jgi:hypothetical protein
MATPFVTPSQPQRRQQRTAVANANVASVSSSSSTAAMPTPTPTPMVGMGENTDSKRLITPPATLPPSLSSTLAFRHGHHGTPISAAAAVAVGGHSVAAPIHTPSNTYTAVHVPHTRTSDNNSGTSSNSSSSSRMVSPVVMSSLTTPTPRASTSLSSHQSRATLNTLTPNVTSPSLLTPLPPTPVTTTSATDTNNNNNGSGSGSGVGGMKITIKRWHGVALWKWNVGKKGDDTDDDCCGICRQVIDSIPLLIT